MTEETNYDRFLTRVWDRVAQRMIYPEDYIGTIFYQNIGNIPKATFLAMQGNELWFSYEGITVECNGVNAVDISSNEGPFIPLQCTGLKDKNGKLIYEGDILIFDNGDKFFINCEKYLEFYVDWIGDPECEDQARDLYRIERAKIIGNIYQNPELLEEK